VAPQFQDRQKHLQARVESWSQAINARDPLYST
jgi:hypothetical protein